MLGPLGETRALRLVLVAVAVVAALGAVATAPALASLANSPDLQDSVYNPAYEHVPLRTVHDGQNNLEVAWTELETTPVNLGDDTIAGTSHTTAVQFRPVVPVADTTLPSYTFGRAAAPSIPSTATPTTPRSAGTDSVDASSDNVIDQGALAGSGLCACAESLAASTKAATPNLDFRAPVPRVIVDTARVAHDAGAALGNAADGLLAGPVAGSLGTAASFEERLSPEAAEDLSSLSLPASPESMDGTASPPAAIATLSSSLTSDDAPLLLVAAAGVGLALLAIPLYRRMIRGKLLDNDVRQAVLSIVQAQPGVHESAIAKQIGIGHTLTQYHIRMLAEFGLVEVKRFHGRKCVFVAGTVGRTEKSLLLAQKGRGAELIAVVAAQPGIGQRDLARALGVADSSVKWHLDRLEDAGVIRVERSAEGKRIRLTDEAQRALPTTPAPAPTPARVALEPLHPGPEGFSAAGGSPRIGESPAAGLASA